MDGRIQWLLDGQPWVAYRTRVDLLSEPESTPAVQKARTELLTHPQIQTLISEFSRWQDEIISSHKTAGLLLHKLVFLADIGLSASDPGIGDIIDAIMAHTDADGVFQVPINVPVHFGGTGINSWGWALCDTPSIYYALAKMGMGNDPSVIQGITHLKSLMRDNGWPCAVSGELGKFRGPGRKDDPCPYATLVMLKALSAADACRDSEACRTAAETLLGLWQSSRERHPYMFYMGTDFRKLKAPFVWYDLLHVADVLSQLDWLKRDERLRDMASVIAAGADENCFFTPQSEWKAWNGWEFAQKKTPSRWVTFLALRILKRVGMNI